MLLLSGNFYTDIYDMNFFSLLWIKFKKEDLEMLNKVNRVYFKIITMRLLTWEIFQKIT
jgi:hypothetical protein